MSEDRYILLLDGSTEVCSAALASGHSGVIAREFESAKRKQSERLAPMVHEVLAALPQGEKLSAMVVAEGPGSYTGLRIVAGYAKGLCMALEIPLYTISTTELMAHTFIHSRGDAEEGDLLLPMIDARRMEIYTALYSSDVKPLSEIEALVLTDEKAQRKLSDALAGKRAYFFGSGAEKAIDLFRELAPSALFHPNIVPDAAAMVKRAFEIIEANECVDATYWEPFYLKEYQAKVGVPNKVLQRVEKNEQRKD